MFETPHKTAIKRSKLSVPMRFLYENNLLSGKILDYGCGRGDDARLLEKSGLCVSTYDPIWQPKMPRGKFDTITCNYVLNVVSEETAKNIVSDIRLRLKVKGTAFISVRSDVKVDTNTQRDVYLNSDGIERVQSISGCRMYRVRKLYNIIEDDR